MGILQQMKESGAENNGAKKYNAFGVVFEVATAEETAKGLKLVGKVLNANQQVNADETVAVLFRGESAGKAITNFIKGNGKGALKTADAAKGTFLTLEGCYFTDEKEDDKRVLSARWLNTLASSRSADHDNRSFIEDVLATAPRISFKNPDLKPGEPDRITLPVNAKTVVAKIRDERGTFDKSFPVDWAIEKLNALPASEKPIVTIDTIEPREAVEVKDRAGLEKALAEQLGRGTKSLALLRITDGDDVFTRAVYVGFKKDGDEYVPDVQNALTDLFKNNVFKGLSNDVLFAGLADGSIKMETVPGYRMSYAGDPSKDDNAAFKLVSEVKQGKTQRYQMIFGDEASRYAKVILPGIARNDTVAGFSPFNILADEPGTYLAAEFDTPHIAPNVAPVPPVAPVDPSAPGDLHDVEHEFDKQMEVEDEPMSPKP